jgi:hypothetical protein
MSKEALQKSREKEKQKKESVSSREGRKRALGQVGERAAIQAVK